MPSLRAARLFFTIWVATIDASSELEELLVMATVQNDPEAVGEFLEAGVGADAISERGVTVLMMASMMGHTEVAKHLLGRGAKTEAADDLGNRPLMLAASYGKLELVGLLLDAGAEAGARDSQGITPLHTVMGSDDQVQEAIELIKLLISSGADPYAQTTEEKTPMDICNKVCRNAYKLYRVKRLLGYDHFPKASSKALTSDMPGYFAPKQPPPPTVEGKTLHDKMTCLEHASNRNMMVASALWE
jgi:ankyrin repeat protein